MTALRCVIDMTIRLGGVNCKEALSYLGRWEGPLAGEALGDGAQPRLPYSTGAASFPRKREPTGRPSARESGNLLGGPSAYAKAGTYPFARLWITSFPPTRE